MNANGHEFPIRGATVGGMATFPGRFDTLQRVVESIAPQLDCLFVYVNEADSIPNFLNIPNVIPLLGTQYAGNISANGKIFPLQFTEDCAYFSLDDDFIFPSDYVAKMKGLLNEFNSSVTLTVHGSIFAPGAEWYYEKTVVYTARRALSAHKLVTLPGSGTFVFDQSSLKVRYEDFPPEPMVDLKFAILAREQNLPIICVARQEKWLESLAAPGLWEAFLERITHHTRVMRETAPWDFEVMREIYRPLFDRAVQHDPSAALLDPEVKLALRGGGIPSSWCRSVNTIKKRNDYLRLIAGAEGQG